MTLNTKDPWETGVGLADDFDGWISEPYFGIDERYASGAATLFCATLIDETGEPMTTIKYSVGEDWEPNQDGSQITHPTKAQINQNSRYGRFIDRMVKPTNERAPKHRQVTSPAGKENGLGLAAELKQNGGTPFAAKTFEGLGFHWNLHKMETMGKDPNTQETIYKDVLLPTSWIGRWKGSATKTAAPATQNVAAGAPAPTPTATPAVAASNGGGTIPINLRKRLTLAILEGNLDVKAFLKVAGRDREVLGLPDDVMGNILDPGPDGFFAQAQG